MHSTTRVKVAINRILRPLNLELNTLTLRSQESNRLDALQARGHFNRPIYQPLLPSPTDATKQVLDSLKATRGNVDSLKTSANSSGFCFDNEYFSSPDAEVMYAFLALHKPRLIVEIGSGNSTRLIRQATTDLRMESRILAIDPFPRADIEKVVDEFWAMRVELIDSAKLVALLGENSLLSIDSSHELKPGNDVAYLYLEVLPQLRPGVLIHIHDIYLPYEYPFHLLANDGREWREQYLVQALLAGNQGFEIIWPGHQLQRTMPAFADYFPHTNQGTATSLYIRKI